MSLYSKYLGFYIKEEFIYSITNFVGRYIVCLIVFLIVDYIKAIPDFYNFFFISIFLLLVVPISHILLIREKKTKPVGNYDFDREKIKFKDFALQITTMILRLSDTIFIIFLWVHYTEELILDYFPDTSTAGEIIVIVLFGSIIFFSISMLIVVLKIPRKKKLSLMKINKPNENELTKLENTLNEISDSDLVLKSDDRFIIAKGEIPEIFPFTKEKIIIIPDIILNLDKEISRWIVNSYYFVPERIKEDPKSVRKVKIIRILMLIGVVLLFLKLLLFAILIFVNFPSLPNLSIMYIYYIILEFITIAFLNVSFIIFNNLFYQHLTKEERDLRFDFLRIMGVEKYDSRFNKNRIKRVYFDLFFGRIKILSSENSFKVLKKLEITK